MKNICTVLLYNARKATFANADLVFLKIHADLTAAQLFPRNGKSGGAVDPQPSEYLRNFPSAVHARYIVAACRVIPNKYLRGIISRIKSSGSNDLSLCVTSHSFEYSLLFEVTTFPSPITETHCLLEINACD